MSGSYKFRKKNESSSPVSNPNSPRSLQNHGNTCYLNATIQVLAHCRLITDWVRRNPTQDMAFENPNGESLFGWRILRLLEDLSGLRNRKKSMFSNAKKKGGSKKKAKESSKETSDQGSNSDGTGAAATKEAVLSLQEENVSPLINGTGQQDSHEFLRLVYTCINAAVVSQVPQHIFPRRRSPFAWLITGETTTRRICSKCGNFTNTVEAWTDLSVPVRIDGNLLDCLRKIFAPVQLQGENAYECSHCGEKVDARQEAHATQLPPVLTLQLQRFAFHAQRASKVTSRVYIPHNFSLATSTPGKPHKISQEYSYSLSGVVCHVGQTVNCGHYVSYVRTKSDEWFKCNDMIITPVSEVELSKDVLFPIFRKNETPYLLLYEFE